MGTHVEWIGAADSGVGLVTEGQGWDGATGEHVEDTVDVGNVALVIGTDTVSVIEGTEGELRRLIARMVEALDSLHPLPELPDPEAADEDEDEVDATCPYVYTQADADAVIAYNVEYTAKMRAMHGDDANLYPRPVPVPGEVCGADLQLWDKDPVYGYLYTQGGRWIVGPRKGGDNGGGDEEVQCGNGHQWEVPEIDEWQ